MTNDAPQCDFCGRRDWHADHLNGNEKLPVWCGECEPLWPVQVRDVIDPDPPTQTRAEDLRPGMQFKLPLGATWHTAQRVVVRRTHETIYLPVRDHVDSGPPHVLVVVEVAGGPNVSLMGAATVMARF